MPQDEDMHERALAGKLYVQIRDGDFLLHFYFLFFFFLASVGDDTVAIFF